jgi:hypothetical protein
MDIKQAKQFKNILQQPIGKMWFPSLGGAMTTSSINIPLQKNAIN